MKLSWRIGYLWFSGWGAITFGRWQDSWHAGTWMLVVLLIPGLIVLGLTDKKD